MSELVQEPSVGVSIGEKPKEQQDESLFFNASYQMDWENGNISRKSETILTLADDGLFTIRDWSHSEYGVIWSSKDFSGHYTVCTDSKTVACTTELTIFKAKNLDSPLETETTDNTTSVFQVVFVGDCKCITMPKALDLKHTSLRLHSGDCPTYLKPV